MTLDEFFGKNVQARRLFDALSEEIGLLGKFTIRVAKSQVAFRRRKNVAVAWMPGKYLKASTAPLVLTLSFDAEDPSTRWKQVTKVSERRFTHHLELHKVGELDAQVREWLKAAWAAAA